MLPSDPSMLISYINMKLRDYDYTLEELAINEGISEEELSERLRSLGIQYISEINQVR